MDARVSMATMPKAAQDQAPALVLALDLVRVLALEEAPVPDLPGLDNGNKMRRRISATKPMTRSLTTCYINDFETSWMSFELRHALSHDEHEDGGQIDGCWSY